MSGRASAYRRDLGPSAAVQCVAVAAGFTMLLLSGSAAASQAGAIDRLIQTRERIRSLAFDPKTFFANQSNQPPAVTISYSGDDLSWPVYAIAVEVGCIQDEPARRGCSGPTARIVRASAAEEGARIRQRGSRLALRVYERGAFTDERIKAELEREGIEWLQADLKSCPTAAIVMARAAAIQWTPRSIVDQALGKPGDLSLMLHADTVQITFSRYLQTATYNGYIANASPAAWAVEFAESLEPCWRPATAKAPWRR